MQQPLAPPSWDSASVVVVFDAPRPLTAGAQPAGRSLPAARAKGRALTPSGSAAARPHTRRLSLKRFSKPTASSLTVSGGIAAGDPAGGFVLYGLSNYSYPNEASSRRPLSEHALS